MRLITVMNLCPLGARCTRRHMGGEAGRVRSRVARAHPELPSPAATRGSLKSRSPCRLPAPADRSGHHRTRTRRTPPRHSSRNVRCERHSLHLPTRGAVLKPRAQGRFLAGIKCSARSESRVGGSGRSTDCAAGAAQQVRPEEPLLRACRSCSAAQWRRGPAWFPSTYRYASLSRFPAHQLAGGRASTSAPPPALVASAGSETSAPW
jgi:hypothetical protein